MNKKQQVHVEVQLRDSCQVEPLEIRDRLFACLSDQCSLFKNGVIDLFGEGADQEVQALGKCIEKICVVDLPQDMVVSFWQAEMHIHVFRMSEDEPEKDFLDGEDESPAFEQWELPNKHLEGLWDSIVVEDRVKNKLLGYCSTSVAFSDAEVDNNVISWNRMALLNGPPGTGKTTLCKALAQKVFVRSCDKYSSGVLLDINAHALFSKWFSESGKLVMKLFEHIAEIAEDEQTLVLVLVDEVESIASSRSSSARSNEPGDAVRVVNSVLTSLDALRRRRNVLVLCTSNMIGGIDTAFLDRVDLQLYLGPPGFQARYRILRSCLVELAKKGIIREEFAGEMELPESLSTEDEGQAYVAGSDGSAEADDMSDVSVSPDVLDVTTASVSKLLAAVTRGCAGQSGRALRKLPLKAHAFYSQTPVVGFRDFLAALYSAVSEDQGEVGRDVRV